jgi:hypothetical protein
MKRNLFAIALSTILGVLCLNGLAHGQTGPSGPGGPSGDQPKATTNGISEQDLEAALKSFDPNLKVETGEQGSKTYHVKVARDGWTYSLRIESMSGCIWINAELSGVIGAPQAVPAAAMAELLKFNFKYGPAHFAFQPAANNGVILNLCQCVARQMTTESLKTFIDSYLKVVKDTYPTWSQVK